jgi:hypothetical protein
MSEQVETPPTPSRRGPTDDGVVNGPHAEEIARLLGELPNIAKVDSLWRRMLGRRIAIWLRLRALGVTQARMASNYTVNGKPIITHTTVSLALTRHDRREAKKEQDGQD